MDIRRGGIYLAHLDPQRGTEPGNNRPVLVVQTDLLNAVGHPSTIVLPLTSRVVEDAEPLRVRVDARDGLQRDCDVLVDQPRAIDNRRLTRGLVAIPAETLRTVERCLAVVFDLPGSSGP